MTARGMYDQPGVPDVQAGTDIGPDGPPDFAAATYTAAEVKVLTEAARKEAGEEVAAEFECLGVILGSYVAERVRTLCSQPSGAVSGDTA